MTETMAKLLAAAKDDLARTCRRRRVKRLELFGSGSGPDFDPDRSDLDFLVEFEELDLGQYADAYFGLLEDLGALFERPIDLVMMDAITNPFFLKNIRKSRAVLYAA